MSSARGYGKLVTLGRIKPRTPPQILAGDPALVMWPGGHAETGRVVIVNYLTGQVDIALDRRQVVPTRHVYLRVYVNGQRVTT